MTGILILLKHKSLLINERKKKSSFVIEVQIIENEPYWKACMMKENGYIHFITV